MRIVVDQDIDGQGRVMASHVIHLDSLVGNTITHPTSGLQVQALAWATAFNALTPAARAAAGWGVVNQLFGEVAPLTRWARLVIAANAAGADPAVKALNLSGT